MQERLETRRSKEIQKLSTLLQISQALSGTLDLKASLHDALDLLARHHDAVKSLVVLHDRDTRELRIEAASGASRTATHTLLRPGDGAIAKVIETGRQVLLHRMTQEPSLVAQMFGRQDPGAEYSFFCVPVTIDRQPVGALAAAVNFVPDRNYERSAKFFAVVASIIAQAVKVQRLVAAQHRKLVNENARLRQELREGYDFSAIVGNSGPMQRVYEAVAQVARTNTTVLIRGESGTGKELVAQAIHYNSLRSKRPFVKVSCGALPETLIESELFGYEKGAFTGANDRKRGRFELANNGTLLLDEIGDVHLGTQVKLLRVLQEREFERLGGTEPVKVNVRLIAATNKDMEQAIAQGTFREDLFYRLNVFTIFVPPLRERKPDVLVLADHFLERFASEHGKDIRRISTPAIDMLTAYHWPGNVRELQNVIERAVLVCDGHVIHAHHLPPTLQTAEASGTVMSVSLEEALNAYERDILQDALKSARGNRAKAARLLRTTDRIFNYKVRKLGIDWKRFK
ncbi:MAG: sigma 54-interacting transcriptional regulator [Acidobacteria bacterium]|nr:sigma 54-interacting transcriptional regulator [Acidobacteriota bacterium]